jgi:predicted nucleic acid-binding Zn ribbon protein
MDIAKIDASCRLKNTLKNEGVTTLEQLAEMSEKAIMKIPNCGRTTLKEMIAVLEQHGLHFKGQKWYSGCHNYAERKDKPMTKRKIIQIVMGQRDDVDNDETYDPNGYVTGGSKQYVKRNTLFALTNDGKIWTRAYRDGHYQEWFTIHTRDITE